MLCAVCGETIGRNPVWVTLGDKGERPALEPFALHAKCYPEGGKVRVQEPSYVDEDGAVREGREFTTQRYLKAKAP